VRLSRHSQEVGAIGIAVGVGICSGADSERHFPRIQIDAVYIAIAVEYLLARKSP